MIGSYLSGQTENEDHVIHLLFSANRWEKAYVFVYSYFKCRLISISLYYQSMREKKGLFPKLTHSRAEIRADIASGTTIVLDRYYYSGCVYSAAKNNPSLSLEWARHPEEGLPRPDICVFLDISP